MNIFYLQEQIFKCDIIQKQSFAYFLFQNQASPGNDIPQISKQIYKSMDIYQDKTSLDNNIININQSSKTQQHGSRIINIY